MHANPLRTALTPTLSQREGVFLRERGTALIFALVMLLLLTLLGITAITTSSLQEKMAGNMYDQYMAQQAGDSVVFDGQSWVFNQAFRPTASCPPAGGPAGNIWDSKCVPATVAAFVGVPTGPNWWLRTNDAWWLANGLAPAVNTNATTSYVSREPRFMVEMIQEVPLDADLGPKKIFRFYFRTTGWSVGISDFARSLVQGNFSKRSDTYQNQ